MRKLTTISASCVLAIAGLMLCVIPAAGAANGNGASACGALEPLWNNTWGGAYGDDPADMVVDSTGIYVVGTSNFMSPATVEIFILKYATNGDFKWAKTWTNGSDAFAGGLAISGGYLYIGGSIAVAAGDTDALLLKYDLDGKEIYNESWGRTGYIDSISDIAVNGDIYTCGVSNKYGNSDIYICRVNQNGTTVNDQFFGTSDPESAGGIACDGTNVFVCGDRDIASNQDALLLKLDTDLNEVGTWLWGGADDDMGYDIALDTSNVYITGATRSYSAGINDICLLKFNKDGACLLNRSWGSTGEDTGYGICLSGGGIYVCGEYNDPVNGANLALLKYDSACNYVWNRTWGGPQYQAAMSLAADATGLYLAGVLSVGMSSDALILKTNFDGTNVPEPSSIAAVSAAITGMALFTGCRKRRGRK